MDLSVRSFYSWVVFLTIPQAYKCTDHSQEACEFAYADGVPDKFFLKFVFKKFSIVSPEFWNFVGIFVRELINFRKKTCITILGTLRWMDENHLQKPTSAILGKIRKRKVATLLKWVVSLLCKDEMGHTAGCQKYFPPCFFFGRQQGCV